jgi:hypothetical protein
LKKLTPVVQAWVLPMRMKSSASFILTPPSSTSNGAWTYTGSPTIFATVTPTGQVAPKGVAGTTAITATQASTTKYESGSQIIADLVTTDGYNIGEPGPGGGIVFYVHADADNMFTSTGSDCDTACKYLEAAPSDQGKIEWCSNTTTALGVPAQGIGSGMSNTTRADNTCTSGAIQVAADYTNNNKTDWHLPSQKELNELCKYARNQTTGDTTKQCDSSQTLRGGFAARDYWSSSEYYAVIAWLQYFYNGDQDNFFKNNTNYVRPVRAF